MLPTSDNYLKRSGFSSSGSAYTMIALFLSGVVAIRLISGYIHNHMPSHIVDCTHTHIIEDPERGHIPTANHDHQHVNTERTPLIQSQITSPSSSLSSQAGRHFPKPPPVTATEDEVNRNSLRRRLSRQISHLMGDAKTVCDDDSNECYGVSQACGQECSKVAHNGDSPPLDNHNHASTCQSNNLQGGENIDGNHLGHDNEASHSTGLREEAADQMQLAAADEFSQPAFPPYQHHHHVPQNAFLSIGLQTSLAIALHKLPEGFITYATNHASPKLGMTVFLALFIHNITEGFAMALPLYLALHSRWKAILWSSLLGGISQPAGAGIAALWIWLSHMNDGRGPTAGPSWGVYGGMFAVTAGIMTAVGLQLFCEGSELTHRRGLCIGCAVGGMTLMGFSFALTA